MTDLGTSRFLPADPGLVFGELLGAYSDLRWKVKNRDDFSRATVVNTPMSGFSWGATLSVTVLPHEGGCVIQVSGGPRMKANITASGPEMRNVGKLLDRVSQRVQAALGGSG